MLVRPAMRFGSIPRAVMASVLAVAVVGGGVAIASTRARAHPNLPPTTASELIASIARAAERPSPISGVATAHVDLGLPSIPQQGGSTEGVGGLLGKLSGDHRIRLWSSADGVRVAELLPADERVLVVGATGGWAWSSASFTAYRLFGAQDVAAAGRLAAAHEAERARMLQVADPVALADQTLSALSPTTTVTLGASVRVADRPAYTLVVQPRDARTLVGHVDIAVDATRRVPLRVEVFAKGAPSAALSAGFGSVSFAPIDPTVYRFTPPPGAQVRSVQQLYHRAEGTEPGGNGSAEEALGPGSAQVFGSGWSTIVAIRVPAAAASGDTPADGSAQIDLRRFLPYSGPLFSVRAVERAGATWLLAGAVPQSMLVGVEARLR